MQYLIKNKFKVSKNGDTSLKKTCLLSTPGWRGKDRLFISFILICMIHLPFVNLEDYLI